jgi:predicted AAA+ superfamily ATPase
MVRRDLAAVLRRAARRYPVVTVTGPRQSGKTTLCRQVFPRKAYVSLEPLDVRERAIEDPRGLLAEHRAGAIFDEVQHAPGLLSYVQAEVDARPVAGRFVLTGSQHFALSEAVAQSLAGRTAVLQLLPLSLAEIRRFPKSPQDLLGTLLAGGYPRIFDQRIPPARWLEDYVATYVQRDVRQVLRVGDLSTFTSFLRQLAGRTGQEVNLSSLGADVGVSYTTMRSWISVLETSFLVFRVPAWVRNVRRRWVKAPKLHWYDSGLVCNLLGIRDVDQLRIHPLRGAIFESWVASEVAKAHTNRGVSPDLFHFRQVSGIEVDLGVRTGTAMALIEAKSGATASDTFLKGLRDILPDLAPEVERTASFVVYGGERRERRTDATVVPWSEVAEIDWTRAAPA